MYDKIIKFLKRYYMWVFSSIMYVVMTVALLISGVGLGSWQLYIVPIIAVLLQFGSMVFTHVQTWREASDATVDKLGEHFNAKLQGELRAIIRKIMEEGMRAEDIQI